MSEPILALPEHEIKWLEETGRIRVIERIKEESPCYTVRDGKTVECVKVRVASWDEVLKAHRMAWAKFHLPKFRRRKR